MAQPLPAGEPKVLLRGAFYGRYVSSGHLLYMRGGTLFAIPFDAERLELRGSRESPVVEERAGSGRTPAARSSRSSDSGTLLYVPGKSIDTELPISWLDNTGKTTVLRAEASDWSHPSFSPDGRQLAMTIGFGIWADVWIYEWSRDALDEVDVRERCRQFTGMDSRRTPDSLRLRKRNEPDYQSFLETRRRVWRRAATHREPEQSDALFVPSKRKVPRLRRTAARHATWTS